MPFYITRIKMKSKDMTNSYQIIALDLNYLKTGFEPIDKL